MNRVLFTILPIKLQFICNNNFDGDFYGFFCIKKGTFFTSILKCVNNKNKKLKRPASTHCNRSYIYLFAFFPRKKSQRVSVNLKILLLQRKKIAKIPLTKCIFMWHFRISFLLISVCATFRLFGQTRKGFNRKIKIVFTNRKIV